MPSIIMVVTYRVPSIFTCLANAFEAFHQLSLIKLDMRKAGEEEDWKKKTRDRGGWKRLSDEAVKKLRAAPVSFQFGAIFLTRASLTRTSWARPTATRCQFGARQFGAFSQFGACQSDARQFDAF